MNRQLRQQLDGAATVLDLGGTSYRRRRLVRLGSPGGAVSDAAALRSDAQSAWSTLVASPSRHG